MNFTRSLFLSNQASKLIVWTLLIFCLNFLNIPISAVGNSKIYIGQFALLMLIGWGLLVAKNFSKTSIKVLGMFFLIFFISSFLGMHNEWFYNDVVKIILLAASMFVYFNLFNDEAEFSICIKILAWIFLFAVIIQIPVNLDTIYLNNRLAILNFGKGGEDLGWAAAVVYILSYAVLSQQKIWKRKDKFLLVALLTITILSLSRDAMLAVAVYALASRKKAFLYQAVISVVLSLLIIYTALVANIVFPPAFFAQNGYRFLIPAKIDIVSNKKNELGSIGPLKNSPINHQEFRSFPSFSFDSKKEALNMADQKAEPLITVSPFSFKHCEWIMTGRVAIWSGFVKYFSEQNFVHQFFGLGVGSVTLNIKMAGFNSRDVHNLYLDVLFNFGILGLLALIWAITASYISFFKARATESYSMLSAILAAAMFNGLWRFSTVIWLTALMFAAPYIWQKIKK